METSTNVDGEAPAALALALVLRGLQWSRRRTSTERPVLRRPQPRRLVASMEPSTNVDGEFRRDLVPRVERLASMEPSTNVDGELESGRAPW